METEKIELTVSNSELIKALGAITKLDLIFWAAITQSTVWAASTRPHATIFSLIWLTAAIGIGAFELAARLRKAPNDHEITSLRHRRDTAGTGYYLRKGSG